MNDLTPLPTLIITAITAGLSAYLGSYLQERGKNLATKEDIGKITEQVEEVRAGFANALEDRKASHQLRAACLDKRLIAHQEAYTLWLDLIHIVHREDRHLHLQACQQWWDKNCLFLDEAPRKAFLAAVRAGGLHSDTVRPGGNLTAIQKSWDSIIGAGPAIETAVGLPAIRDVIPPESPAFAT